MYWYDLETLFTPVPQSINEHQSKQVYSVSRNRETFLEYLDQVMRTCLAKKKHTDQIYQNVWKNVATHHNDPPSLQQSPLWPLKVMLVERHPCFLCKKFVLRTLITTFQLVSEVKAFLLWPIWPFLRIPVRLPCP